MPRPGKRRVPLLANIALPDAPEWALASSHWGYPDTGDNLTQLDLATFFDGYDAGSTAAVIVFGSEAAPALPSGWTNRGTGSIGTLDYAVGTLVLTGTDDWIVDFAGIPSDWDTGSYDDLDKFKVGAFAVMYGGVNDGTLTASVSTSAGNTGAFTSAALTAPWNALLGTPTSATYQPGSPTWVDRYDLEWSDYPSGPTTIGVIEQPYLMAVIGASDAYTMTELTGTAGLLDGYFAPTLGDPISGDWVQISFGWTA